MPDGNADATAMNFFEYQDRARKLSRRLLLIFAVAVLAVVTAVDLVLLLVLGRSNAPPGQWQPLSGASLAQNLPLLLAGAVGTVLIISLASLFRTVKLRSGGGQVAPIGGEFRIAVELEDRQALADDPEQDLPIVVGGQIPGSTLAIEEAEIAKQVRVVGIGEVALVRAEAKLPHLPPDGTGEGIKGRAVYLAQGLIRVVGTLPHAEE